MDTARKQLTASYRVDSVVSIRGRSHADANPIKGEGMSKIRWIRQNAAIIITASLIAALFAGGSALAVKAFTKKSAKKLFYTKSVSDSTFAKNSDVLKNNSSGVGIASGGLDLGPSYLDLASTQVKTNGGRVLATADISLRDTTATIDQIECFLRVGSTDIDHWVATTQDTTGARRPVYSLVGASGPLAAGTYTVLLRCGNAAAVTGVFEDSAHVIGWNG
jgi:hypothetical protein